MNVLILALKLARRDLRGALGSFWIVVAGIALGVAVIAAIGSTAGAVLDGVRAGAQVSVGGDVSLRLFHRPAGPEERAFLEASGRYSETAELRPLARRVDGTGPTLVELKGVDDDYPLYGAVTLEPAQPLDAALASHGGVWGAVVDPALGEAMGLGPGERLRLGAIDVEIRAWLVEEPDRALRAFSLGPRVMIARAALEESGLAPPGAQVYWYSRVRLSAGTDAAAWIAEVERRFPEAGWRIVNAAEGVPGVERTAQIAQVLLVLIGLAVLLIGGVGVGSAVSAHLARKTGTIAILRSLGATPRLVFAVYLVEVMAAAALGVAIGLVAGALAPVAVRPLAGEWLPPGDAVPAVQPAALGVAAAFGLLTALLFSLWPLARTGEMTPRQLFRDLTEPVRRRRWRVGSAMAAGVTAAAMLALLLTVSEMPMAALLFAGAAAVAVLLFLGLGRLVRWAAARAGHVRRPLLRLAVGNLWRPGAATPAVVMALGLTLTVLVAVKTVEGNALRHLDGTLPQAAPDIVFINIPPAEGAAFEAAVTGVAGVGRVERMPFLHARLTHVGGEPVHQRRIPREVAWVVRGDRGLSWAAQPPAGTRIVEGDWWAERLEDGRRLASVDAQVARQLGVGIGDGLTLNILGEPVEAEIANLRAVDWTGLGLDFPILLSPPAEPPPHSQVAAVWAEAEALDAVEAAVLARFPEAPPIRVAPVLSSIAGMVEGVAGALTAVSGVTVVAGMMVLAGSIAAGYRRRVAEMVLLKVVGARPRQLMTACVIEFALLGIATAAVAGILGTTAGYAVVRQVMPDNWVFLPAVPILLGTVAVAAMAAAGLWLARRALDRSPGAFLRGTG